MLGFFKYFTVILLISFAACKSKPYGEPIIKPETILKDQSNFLKYWYSDLNLSEDFISLNDSATEISKGVFLRRVSSGSYLPLRLKSDTPVYYKLYKIHSAVDQLITSYLADIGTTAYKNYEWEGKPLPLIDFIDLNGNHYNPQTIKDKILVLDFWFIGCTSCVQEMPKLNEIVKQYKNRKDILFLAIAFDREEPLREFKKRINFQYEIVSDTSSYLNKKLGITSYSTFAIVNKKGEVVKILDDQYHSLENLREQLRREAVE